MNSFIEYNGLIINESFIGFLKETGLADFRILSNFEDGNHFKKNKFRSVVRIEMNNRIFYLKKHYWPFKERMRFIFPWLNKEDAFNEWNNLLLLDSLGFNTMTPVAFGEKRRFGIPCFSLTLTENLYDCEKMEKYLPSKFAPPLSVLKIAEKRAFLRKLAVFARDFHNNGLNHQDFYLGHLYIRPKDGSIFIIDIQRLHKRKNVSSHDRVKDLAQLAYSARTLNVFSRTDFMRFMHEYIDKDRLTQVDKKLIKKTTAKTKRIAAHDAKLQLRKRII